MENVVEWVHRFYYSLFAHIGCMNKNRENSIHFSCCGHKYALDRVISNQFFNCLESWCCCSNLSYHTFVIFSIYSSEPMLTKNENGPSHFLVVKRSNFQRDCLWVYYYMNVCERWHIYHCTWRIFPKITYFSCNFVPCLCLKCRKFKFHIHMYMYNLKNLQDWSTEKETIAFTSASWIHILAYVYFINSISRSTSVAALKFN
jgi:hypothetical protein